MSTSLHFIPSRPLPTGPAHAFRSYYIPRSNVVILSTALLLVYCASSLRAASPATIDEAVAAIARVGPEGAGNVAAGQAWRQLVELDATAIPRILAGMDGANELAVNYLRSAVDAIAEREIAAGGQLPQSALEAFLADADHHPRARRLAYELIARICPRTAGKLLPRFVNDPSVELRREAVQQLIDQADQRLESKQTAAAIEGFQEALGFARDAAQIKKVAAELRKLEVSVDLPRHFGFLTHWRVIGPFDNTALAGFDAVYPPEEEIEFDAECEGKSAKVKWVEAATDDEYGMLDINPICGEEKEVVAYALAEFDSAEARPAELRLGCKNGWKIWVNGEFIFGRDEYHRGARLDQYRLPIELKLGMNTILVKVCQNEMVQDWTKQWEFQLRVCDASGTAILAQNRLPTAGSAAKATPEK